MHISHVCSSMKTKREPTTGVGPVIILYWYWRPLWPLHTLLISIMGMPLSMTGTTKQLLKHTPVNGICNTRILWEGNSGHKPVGKNEVLVSVYRKMYRGILFWSTLGKCQTFGGSYHWGDDLESTRSKKKWSSWEPEFFFSKPVQDDLAEKATVEKSAVIYNRPYCGRSLYRQC